MKPEEKRLREAIISHMSMLVMPWADGPLWLEEIGNHAAKVLNPAFEAWEKTCGFKEVPK